MSCTDKKQLIDLLNQIATASDNLRDRCRAGMKSLDRGVVAYMNGAL